MEQLPFRQKTSAVSLHLTKYLISVIIEMK